MMAPMTEEFRRGTHCADDKRRAPVPDETVEALKFCREVHFSAKNDRGRDELEAALRGAVAWLREAPSFRRWNARIPVLSERYWA